MKRNEENRREQVLKDKGGSAAVREEKREKEERNRVSADPVDRVESKVQRDWLHCIFNLDRLCSRIL